MVSKFWWLCHSGSHSTDKATPSMKPTMFLALGSLVATMFAKTCVVCKSGLVIAAAGSHFKTLKISFLIRLISREARSPYSIAFVYYLVSCRDVEDRKEVRRVGTGATIPELGQIAPKSKRIQLMFHRPYLVTSSAYFKGLDWFLVFLTVVFNSLRKSLICERALRDFSVSEWNLWLPLENSTFVSDLPLTFRVHHSYTA